MPDFQSMFMASKGEPVEYLGRTLHMVDEFPLTEAQCIEVSFEHASPDWRQGVHLSTTGTFEVNGQSIHNAALLWQDTAPARVELIVHSQSGVLVVKNVWDVGDGVTHSWHGGGAMRISVLGQQRRYECNDGRANDDFSDLVFSLTLRE